MKKWMAVCCVILALSLAGFDAGRVPSEPKEIIYTSVTTSTALS